MPTNFDKAGLDVVVEKELTECIELLGEELEREIDLK